MIIDVDDGGTGESLLEMLVSMSVSPPLMCSSVSLSHSGHESWSLELQVPLVPLVLDSTLALLVTPENPGLAEAGDHDS